MTKAELYERIYQMASLIPSGKVATYGQLAFMAGLPRGGRMAGQAMANVKEGCDIPCHRVVNSAGRCAPGFLEQRALLQAEGVTFLKDGRVDMKRHMWNPMEKPPQASKI
jgi:methylated-DNA-protein-cysteine methyltransferase-like protein